MASDGTSGQKPTPPVKFARRTFSGRYVSFGSARRDDPDSASPADFASYHVRMPPTSAGGRPVVELSVVDPSVSDEVEQRYVSSSLFTGGFNAPTRAHLMPRVAESPRESAAGGACSIQGCSNRAMADERGGDVLLLPCDCNFLICAECFRDAARIGGGEGGVCPGCKEPYRADFDEYLNRAAAAASALRKEAESGPSPPPPPAECRSLVPVRTFGDFDHNRWLFETKGTYGYGNAFWPEEDGRPSELKSKPWRPLTRKLKIPAAILSPYRILIFVRMAALALFLAWRVKHPNQDAVWLWGMSVVCELWFAFSWLLDQLPKLCPCNRTTNLDVLKEKFESPTPFNPTGRSDLPGVDVFVSTADPEKEPPLVTANTILSILATDYPVEKLSCYVSDDGGALLTFEAMAEAASFADLWVPFCRKHGIEPRNPETYFGLKRDPTKNKVRPDFVKERRRVKREYDEFKVRINGLPDSIRRRSEACNAQEEVKAMRLQRERAGEEDGEAAAGAVKVPKSTWMADGTHWPGTWIAPSGDHSKGDHAGIIQVLLHPPREEPQHGTSDESKLLDLAGVDVRLPMLVYVSREKRPGYDHNKKAGAMNALVRASAVLSNGAFILNLDCDHYVYNSLALREGMCFMMDRGGDRICYVQFPQRFEGIDPSDRYANQNTVFFDVNMRALDGLQGPVYVGTGCLFRRTALYGFDPPRHKEISSSTWFGSCFPRLKSTTTSRTNASVASASEEEEETKSLRTAEEEAAAAFAGTDMSKFPKMFGNSYVLIDSIPVAEYQGRPLADHPSVKNGRPPGALLLRRGTLGAAAVAEAISVISCWYEEKTEWGRRVGWIYGSVTEDVVTGYRMHNRGWRSVYCVTKRDAFRGTAPINLTDRLHQVLRWATGSVEIFFSRNNALLASTRMKLLQRIAYLNVGIYPFTSIFLIVYCFLPALSLFSGQFIVQNLNVTFLAYLLAITLTLILLAGLEVKWSGIGLEEWWRNEQFWLIGGTSAHFAAVLQGLLKVIAGIDISFTLTSKSGGEDADDEFADLYIVKWSSLMIPPITIMMVNVVAIAVGVSRTIYSVLPQWSRLLGGVFFSFWVLVHLYPFAKGLMGRRGRAPTIVFIWSGLIAITISLLWVSISPPSGARSSQIGGSFTFP